MMKKVITTGLFFVLGILATQAQVGIGTPQPNASAQLDIVSQNSGLLIPRLALKSSTDATTIANGNVESLMVYNTATVTNDISPGYYYWNGTKWNRIAGMDDIALLQTISTLVNNGDGTYTYTDEGGAETIVDVPASVVNQFEDILNSGPVTINGITYNTLEEYLQQLVTANETISTLVNNGDGTYTYTDEGSAETIVDVPASVTNQFEDIVNSGPVTINGITYNTLEEYLKQLVTANETISTLVNNGDGTYTYTDEGSAETIVDVPADIHNELIDNTSQVFNDIKNIVETEETMTSLVDNGNGTITYTDEGNQQTIINIGASAGASDGDAWGVTGEDQAGAITRTGNVGIGAVPTQRLDVNGTLLLRRGNLGTGSSPAPFGNDQLLFGFGGTSGQAHAIKSRHNNVGALGNALDIFLYTPTDGPAGRHVMTLNALSSGGGAVGIDITTPTQALDVDGTARLRGINGLGGLATDRVVVSDATGVLRTINSASLGDGDAWGVTGENQTAAITRTGAVTVNAGSVEALHITANRALGNSLASFTHSNGTQGVAVDWAGIYKIGSFANSDMNIRAGGTGRVILGSAAQQVQIPSGNPGVGKVLTSDAAGVASWQDASAPETTTNLAQNTTTSVITYTNELANMQTARVVSANGGNMIDIGNDGGALMSSATIASAVPDATTTFTGKVQLAGDLGGTGTIATSPKVGGLQGRPVSATAPTTGQVLTYNGTSWTPTTPGAVTENDGIIGNEVTDVIPGRGLQRTGTGTDANPYRVGLINGTSAGQTMQWNGTNWGLTTAGAGTVTSVTGTAPISVATGSTTPVISLNDAGVSNVKLAPDAVTTDKIMDGTVTNADLANGTGGIYKGSGSLSGATTVTQGANKLSFNSTATDGFAVDGSTFSVDAANNRVGIGTSTPNARLEVNGKVRVSDLSGANLSTDLIVIADAATGELKQAGTIAATLVPEPWFGTDNNAAATQNTEDIYTMGDVGIGTASPNDAAQLDLAKTNKGLLLPRIALTSTTDVTTIANPAAGMFVYNTTDDVANSLTPNVYFFDGTKWVAPLLTERTGTTPPTPDVKDFTGAAIQLTGNVINITPGFTVSKSGWYDISLRFYFTAAPNTNSDANALMWTEITTDATTATMDAGSIANNRFVISQASTNTPSYGFKYLLAGTTYYFKYLYQPVGDYTITVSAERRIFLTPFQ